MADQTVTQSTSVTNSDDNDQTAQVITKAVISMLCGPKVSAILARYGIALDPTIASAAIMGLIHKLHLWLGQETGWKILQ